MWLQILQKRRQIHVSTHAAAPPAALSGGLRRHPVPGDLRRPAVAGDGGYPYAVPLSYVYQEGTLFFHCAKAGHKLDALRRCSKASFCVIDQDQVVPPEYTTYFRSVIAFGRTRILEDEAEKQAAIWLLAEKYCPGDSRSIARRPFAGRPADCALCRSPSST